MLDKLFQLISEQAVRAASRIESIPGEPKHVYLLNGTKQMAEPNPAKHEIYTIQSIVNLVKTCKKPALWVNRAGITLVFDMDSRRDVAKFAFRMSPQFHAVLPMDRSFNGGSSYAEPSTRHTQRSLIRWLKLTFPDGQQACANLVPTLLKVRVEKVQVNTSQMTNRKSSIGKEINAEVTGVELLPDDFTLTMPLYDGELAHLNYQVRFLLEIDGSVEPALFTVTPLAGDLENALQHAEEAVYSLLSDRLEDSDDPPTNDCPVYYGNP